MRKTVIAFVGQIAPDSEAFNKDPGFSRAGNLAQAGFIDALHSSGASLNLILSCQPVAYYPHSKTCFKAVECFRLASGLQLTMAPLINVWGVRELIRAGYIYGRLFLWILKNLRNKRVILQYNMMHPPLLPLLFMTKLFRSKLAAILYDVDVELCEGMKRGLVRRLVFGLLNGLVPFCIRNVDGRIIIADSIKDEFAPQKHALRVDGGVTEEVEERLFPLEPGQNGDGFVVLFAGGLGDWNHVPLILEMMRKYPELKIKLWFAGDGSCAGSIRSAMVSDRRIEFFGMLDHDELFSLYERADVLLCLRSSSDPSMKFHFPSKLLEVITVGRPVIANSITHIKNEYGDYCFVIDDETPLALCCAIQSIMNLSPEERLAFGKKARNFMLQEHTWKTQGIRIRDYLENVV